MFKLSISRIYDNADDKDGYRVLVDRLWPRGVSKEEAKIDEWAKEIAPSNELRKSFDHQPDKMAEFRKGYLAELEENHEFPDFKKRILDKLKNNNVTLLYAAKDEANNNAVVLKEALIK